MDKEGDRPCTSYGIALMDAIHLGWSDEKLSNIACNALNKNVEQRIFLHSMGNLIFYNAIDSKRNGNCSNSIDKNRDQIFSLGAPIVGAEIVSALQYICNYVYESYIAYGLMWADPTLKKDYGKFCTSSGKAQEAYLSLLPKHNFKQVLQSANQNVTGAVCGTGGNDSYLYDFLRLITDICSIDYDLDNIFKNNNNDGVVLTADCEKIILPGHKYEQSNTSLFWEAPFDHPEISGRTDQRDVLVWLKDMLLRKNPITEGGEKNNHELILVLTFSILGGLIIIALIVYFTCFFCKKQKTDKSKTDIENVIS